MRVLEDRVVKLQKDVKNATTRERNAKKKCQQYIAMVKEKNLITEELEEKLSLYKGDYSRQQFVVATYNSCSPIASIMGNGCIKFSLRCAGRSIRKKRRGLH